MGLDPNYLYDNADVIWYGTEGYSNALSALQKVTGQSELAVEMNLNAKYGAADYWTAMQALEEQGVVVARNSNGYRCFAYRDSVMVTSPTGPMSAIDSNATSTTMVQAAPVYDTVVDTTVGSATEGKVLTNPLGSALSAEHGFYGWKFFAGECLQAVSAASMGITLGKVIDSTLYNINPDFWDANGMGSLNPETWASITNGDDSFAAGLFNVLLGIDPNTGNAQLFLEENAAAYSAYYMAQQGLFDPSTMSATSDLTTNLQQPIKVIPAGYSLTFGPSPYGDWQKFYSECPMILTRSSSAQGVTFMPIASTSGRYGIYEKRWRTSWGQSEPGIWSSYANVNINTPVTHNNMTVYYTSPITGATTDYDNANISLINNPNSATRPDANSCWTAICGNITTTGGLPSQPNATVPDVSQWDSPQAALTSLQNQYPSLWSNAVPNTVVQPDGSTQTITYIPVATPQVDSQWDTQPTTNPDSTQSSPQVQPQPTPTIDTNDLISTILKIITMPQSQPDSETQTQPQEQPQPEIPSPPTTGAGDSPTPIAPTGNASALWSVYHPTQAQVNSFGSWLWGSPFLTNIGKLFTNPIDGVISLHKIFVNPVDSGTGTIVVGTLDSEVPSATVNQQYVYVDCGSVSCSEYFGNVFDYPPHTSISLYLPFIGIVPLDTNDVMRAIINVKYGVDVYTGACLAMVDVNRDGCTVNMYQYAGVASVEYPLSNVQNGQLVSGLLAIGAGVASMIATGGITAPAAGAVVAGVATSAKSSVGKSGGFSGNSGAMGIKKPYLIIQRPQVKTADTFPRLEGYPTNYSCKLSDCSNHVKVKSVHVEGIPATDTELEQIETLLKDGILI